MSLRPAPSIPRILPRRGENLRQTLRLARTSLTAA